MDATQTAPATPAEHVISRFGGLTKAARALGYAVSTVQGWKDRGKIPQDHWKHIIAAANAEGITLRIEDFIDAAPAGEAA